MATVHLIRHGQASFGAADYDQLSSLGERQSALLGRWFARTGLAPDHIVLGALKRHRGTADACLAAWGREAGPRPHPADPGFDEYDGEDVLARARPDLATFEAMNTFLAASDDAQRAFQTVFSGATRRWLAGANDAEYRESWQVFSQRCEAALLRAVQAAGDGATLCVFTSAGVIGTLCQQALALPDAQAMSFAWVIRNTSVTTLAVRAERTLLHGFNHVGHLEAEGDPGLLTYR